MKMTTWMRQQWKLMAADDNKGGGGGGGGDGDKGGEVNEATKKFVNDTINGAMKQWSTRLEGKFGDGLKGLKDEIAGGLKDSITAALKEAGAGGAGGDGDGKGKGKESEIPDEIKQQLARQNAEIEKLSKENAAERKKREDGEAQVKRNEERGLLETHLRKGVDGVGVREELLRPLIAFLHGESGRIKRDKEGNVVMTFKRDGYDEDVTLDKAIPEYLGTDEGKAYLPPKDAGGSGNKGGGNNPRAPKPGEKMSVGSALSILTTPVD